MTRKRWQKRVAAPVFVKAGENWVRAIADDRIPCPEDFTGRLRQVSWTDEDGITRSHLDDGSFWYMLVSNILHLSLGIPGGSLVYLVWGEPAYGASDGS